METLYVHIPFCREKCNYCDFVSAKASRTQREAYLALLANEGELYRDLAPCQGLQTIFFGGGTPSLLSPENFSFLLEHFRDVFGFGQDMEITVEANPESVDAYYLKELFALGIKRVSFGAQAFQDHLLQSMGRRHTAKEIGKAVEAAIQGGFSNISIDLIYGLPRQTMAEWQESLREAVALPITHLSAYGLKLSDCSPWGKLFDRGALILPDDDLNGDMQLYSMKFLEECGLHRYEIANFAKNGHVCRHNLAYWRRKDYLGLGLNASSLLQNVRIRNVASHTSYKEAIERGSYPYEEREVLSPGEIMEEELFLPLRLTEGLNMVQFEEKYGYNFFTQKKGQMVKLLNAGLIKVEKGQLKLTNRGVLLNNEVASLLI
ncbi:MAG: radical SAM family heme chaperone HemW [Bacillota bacterium]|nr:radical SAM family heme chaperone HemW [Bacillota bacterium]